MSKTPVITDMKVIPCAGYDSMLLSLSGAHGPLFTRNIVIITDNSGSTGIGEVHGGDDITKILESYIPLVVGKTIGEYKSIISSIRNNGYVPGGNDGQGLQKLDLSNLKFVVHAETAVECALLDLMGKFLGLPVCELLGDGQQRDEVVIPKSVHRERMEQNLDVFDFVLDGGDMQAIEVLDEKESAFFSHYDPETVEFLTGFGR